MIRHILAVAIARAIAALVLLQRCLRDPRALPAATLPPENPDPLVRLHNAHLAMGSGRRTYVA